ncbi:MAG: hypothetical protein RL205_1173, partial [Actinomycetota bacterium]
MSAGTELLPIAPEIPSDGVLFHVGVHKTGTTALQAALADARVELASQGILYPGKRSAQHQAALAILGRTWGWKDNGGWATPMSRYEKLVEQVSAHRGRIVISSEFFCETDAETSQRIANDLGRERLKVVITMRNLGSLLPSSWQQYLKYGIRAPYETWLHDVFDNPQGSTITPTFWRRHDHGAVAKRWAEAVGRENVTVMVLEGVDRRANYVAFAQMLGVSEEILTSRMNLTSNRSMTAAEAEFLRQLNVVAKKEMSWAEYVKYIRNGVALGLVEGREPDADEPRVHTPDWALDAAVEHGNADADTIASLGINVLGNLDALRS